MLKLINPYTETPSLLADEAFLRIADLDEFVEKFNKGEKFSNLEKRAFIHSAKTRLINPNEDGYHASSERFWIKMALLNVNKVLYGIVYEEDKTEGDAYEDFNYLTEIEKVNTEIKEVKVNKVTRKIDSYESSNYHEI